MHFLNIWAIKATPKFRSIEQDRFNLCIEQLEKKNKKPLMSKHQVFYNTLMIFMVLCFNLETAI